MTIEANGGLVNVDPEVGVEAIYEVQGTLTLVGPDAWTGPFRTQVSDLAGNLLFEYEGTVSGTRRSAQPY